MSDVVLRIENLSKVYQLGTIGSGTLGHDLNRWWAKLWGQPDPLSKVDTIAATGEHRALTDINLEVRRGEAIGIVGKNGAGKSTLLKILSRVTGPTSGRVLVKGRIASLLEVGTGFHPELTGRENVYINGALLGMRTKEVRSRFDEIFEFSGVGKYIDTPVKRYSSGMYVRLAFAVAAHLESDILIVDEVLAVGDAEFQKKCLGKIGTVTSQEGRTVLFVSHNALAVEKLCTGGIYLRAGRVAMQGSVSRVLRQYNEDNQQVALVPLKDREDRKGNGVVRFQSVEFLDRSGKRVNFWTTGQEIRVLLHFVNTRGTELKQMLVGLGIDNHLGQRITNLNNRTCGQIFEVVEVDKVSVQVVIAKVPLTPGQYRFSLYCTVENELADWIPDSAVSFSVEPGDFFGSGELLPEGQGNFIIDCKWDVP